MDDSHEPKDAAGTFAEKPAIIPAWLLRTGTALLGAGAVAAFQYAVPETQTWTLPARLTLQIAIPIVLLLLYFPAAHLLGPKRIENFHRYGARWDASGTPICAKDGSPLRPFGTRFSCAVCRAIYDCYDDEGNSMQAPEALIKVRKALKL